MEFAVLDYGVFVLYIVGIVALGLWVSRTRKGGMKKIPAIIFWQVKPCPGGPLGLR